MSIIIFHKQNLSPITFPFNNNINCMWKWSFIINYILFSITFMIKYNGFQLTSSTTGNAISGRVYVVICSMSLYGNKKILSSRMY